MAGLLRSVTASYGTALAASRSIGTRFRSCRRRRRSERSTHSRTSFGGSEIYRGDLPQLLTRIGEPIHHNAPNPAEFAPVGDIEGRRVLTVDDTFTTGARVQSVAAAVPIGRVIDTKDREEKAEFWRRQPAIGFDFDTCCLE